MTTIAKIFFTLVILGCIALIVIAPTGFIEREVRFFDWWQGGSYEWGFRISVIAFSVSIISIMLTLWFAWMDRKMYAMFDETLSELKEQRNYVESLDANLERIITICADNRTALSRLEATIDASGEAISTSNDVNGKATRAQSKEVFLQRSWKSSDK